MAQYIKSTDFAIKDALITGDPLKIVSGIEINDELNAIQVAVNSKADTNSPTLTGVPLAPTAAAGTNTTQIATTAFAKAAADAAFPVGGIIMWSGTIAAIPSGWALCNGSNGTPDLRDRFIIGARQDDAGTAKTNVTGSLTQTGGSKDAIVVSHTHTFSATTNSTGNHQHIQAHGQIANVSPTYPYGTGTGTDSAKATEGGGYSYTRPLTSTAGNHSHTVSGTTDSAGSSGTNANLPPYYALAFIMKTA